MLLKSNGKYDNEGICNEPSFQAVSADAIHMVIVMYEHIIFENHIVAQSIVN